MISTTFSPVLHISGVQYSSPWLQWYALVGK